MKDSFKILTILGSPHDRNSNTRALAEDFVSELASAGVKAQHEVISLGRKLVQPCKGCWNCTRNAPCPLDNDDLAEIKQAMVDCDMLILGSPVYTNQVSAQMKAFFDRLFTWCHVFPLLGKYSLSVVTTGNDGQKETGDFLEKMLATYGTFSFGTLTGDGALTPGFWPRRRMFTPKVKKMAHKAARTIRSGKQPQETKWLRRMFKVMKRKLTGIHVINFIANGHDERLPDPPKFLTWVIRTGIRKCNISREQTEKLAKLMQFELEWWRDRNWLQARSLHQILHADPRSGFSHRDRLLGHSTPSRKVA